jgi:hypothetical protein
MTASVHTPGPWRAILGKNGDYDHAITSDASGYGDSRVGWVREYPHEVGIANARLIAAAPDLLAACEHLLFANKLFSEPDHKHNPDTEWEKAMDMAESAIASARNALQEGA